MMQALKQPRSVEAIAGIALPLVAVTNTFISDSHDIQ